jgi:hypothetical protein
MSAYVDRAAAVVLLAALSWAALFWLPLSMLDWGERYAAPAANTTPAAAVTAATLRERPLFQQSRRIGTPAAAGSGDAPQPFDQRFRLIGMISSTDGTVLAMVEERNSKKVHRLAAGVALEQWTFAGFSEDGAVFQQDAQPDLVLKTAGSR